MHYMVELNMTDIKHLINVRLHGQIHMRIIILKAFCHVLLEIYSMENAYKDSFGI